MLLILILIFKNNFLFLNASRYCPHFFVVGGYLKKKASLSQRQTESVSYLRRERGKAKKIAGKDTSFFTACRTISNGGGRLKNKQQNTPTNQGGEMGKKLIRVSKTLQENHSFFELENHYSEGNIGWKSER